MAVDDERSARVLLEPERDLVETCLVLIVDPGRVEREEDRAARYYRVNLRRWRRCYRHSRRAAATRASIAAACAVGGDINRDCDGAAGAGSIECNLAAGCGG